MTHAFCRNCAAIQTVVRHPLVMPDTSGKYLGGDIVCSVCAWIVATMYVEKPVEVPHMTESLSHCPRCGRPFENGLGHMHRIAKEEADKIRAAEVRRGAAILEGQQGVTDL